VNIEYIYERASNPTLKKYLLSWEHRAYILKGFKSHIEKILCYPFKLKYLNQKVFYPTLKKHNFFLVNIEYIYERALNPTWKK